MAEKYLKIAIFHLAFIYSGGGEKLVLEEARSLKRLGHRVEIFAPVVDKNKCFPDLMGGLKVKTFLPFLSPILYGHESFQILLTCLVAPILAARFRKFDVILAANQPSPWIAWWAKKFYKIPYVSYLAQPTRFLYPRKIDIETGLSFSKKASISFSVKLMQFFKKFIFWADKLSIRESNYILANGEYVKTLLEKVYGVKAFSCPAGAHSSYGSFDHNRTSGFVIAGKHKIQKPYLLLTNRHFPQKRFEYGILALAAALERFPEYYLVITGQETDYTRELRVLIKRLNLERRVVFTGYVPNADLLRLYANASCYLYTAPEEDFGMGIVEAMMLATPVVAWNNAGPMGIIRDGLDGYLARPFSASDFIRATIKIISDEKLARRLGKSARAEAIRRFSYRNHTRILGESLSACTRAGK